MLVIACSLPHASFAQAFVPVTGGQAPPTFVQLADYTKSSQFTNVFNSGSLPAYINAIFTTALSIGAILAVLRIAYAGYMYMGSADMWGNKQKAREILGDAIIGLLLLFGIYLILNQINPNLLNLNVLQDISQTSATPNAGATSNCTPSSVGSPACANGQNASPFTPTACNTPTGQAGFTNAQGGCDVLTGP